MLLWWKLISIISTLNLAVLIRYGMIPFVIFFVSSHNKTSSILRMMVVTGLLLAPSKDSMTSHERWMQFLMVRSIIILLSVTATRNEYNLIDIHFFIDCFQGSVCSYDKYSIVLAFRVSAISYKSR